jgi:hypothetical protein
MNKCGSFARILRSNPRASCPDSFASFKTWTFLKWKLPKSSVDAEGSILDVELSIPRPLGNTIATIEANFVPNVTDPESTDYFDARGALPQVFNEDEEEARHQLAESKNASQSSGLGIQSWR